MLIKSGKLVIKSIKWNRKSASEAGVRIADLPKKLTWDITEDMDWDDDESDIGIYDSLYHEYEVFADEIKYEYQDVEYVEDEE